MMRLPPFKYYAPETTEEACRILAGEGAQAQVVAGGTDLFPNMKRRHQRPRSVVGLKRIADLRGTRGEPATGLRIGACSTLTSICRDRRVRDSYPGLLEALSVISSPALRNMGTIGGNICLDTRCNYYDQTHEWRKAVGFCMKCDGDTCWVAPGSDTCLAVSSTDSAPLLCAIGASVVLSSVRGERQVAMRGLYRKDGIAYLAKEPDEIMTELLLPPVDGWVSSYRKLARRGSIDFPILGVGAAIWRGRDGSVSDAGIYLGAVASAPVSANEAAAALVGRPLSRESITEAAQKAGAPAKPMDNTDLDYAWRKKMVKVYVGRALEALL